MNTRHVILLLASALTGCGANIPTLPLGPLTPYKMDVQQGNVVTQEMISKVQPGMSRSQVRFALGTPLVVDVFHPDRWDYVYMYQKGGVVTEQRRIVAVFKADKLVRIEGDVVPAGAPGAAPPAAKKPAASVQPPEKPAPGSSNFPR